MDCVASPANKHRHQNVPIHRNPTISFCGHLEVAKWLYGRNTSQKFIKRDEYTLRYEPRCHIQCIKVRESNITNGMRTKQVRHKQRSEKQWVYARTRSRLMSGNPR